MTDQQRLDAIAVRILEFWLLQNGFIPGDFDPEDKNCVRDYGPHRVWTVQARIPDECVAPLDLDKIFVSLGAYLAHHNAAPTAVKFHPYGLETYSCPCGCGRFLYVSIYQ